MPTQSTTTPPSATDAPALGAEDTFLVRLAHRSMREDLAALVAALDATPARDRRRARRLLRWFTELRRVLDHHGMEEDTIFWPALAAVDEGFATELADLHRQHQLLDDALDGCATALAGLAATGAQAEAEAAREAAGRLRAVVEAHLDHEDATYVARYQARIDPATHLRLSAEAQASASPRLMGFIGPWFLDHADEADTVRLLALVPRTTAWVLQGPMASRYRRLARDVREVRAARDGGPGRGRLGGGAGRARVVPVALLAAAVALAVVLTACGGDDSAAGDLGHAEHAEHAAGAGPVAPTVDDDGVVEVVLQDHRFSGVTSQVRAGQVRLEVRNEGRSDHQVHLARVPDDVTPEAFLERFRAEGEGPSLARLDLAGGLAGVPAGGEGAVTVELQPGRHLLLCFLPTGDGSTHLMEGMVAELEVAGPTTPAPDPRADVVVDMADFAIAIPEGFTGKGTIEFRNVGAEPHEAALLRIDDGKTMADVVAHGPAGRGEPPYTFMGGAGLIGPGRSEFVEADLPPGDYLAVCAMASPDGQVHLEKGMVATFTIP